MLSHNRTRLILFFATTIAALITTGVCAEQRAPTASEKPAISTRVPNIPPGTFPDQVTKSLTKKLDGKTITYRYSSGRKYNIRFYDDRLTFKQPNNPKAPTVTLGYYAQEMSDDIYLVHWLAPGYTGHVALVIDLNKKQLFGSALMPGQYQLFDSATIE